MKRILSVVCVLSLVSLSKVSYGEYKLTDAIEAARKNNFGMHISQTALDKAKLSRIEAVSGFWPKIDVKISAHKQADKYSRDKNGQIKENNSIDKYNLDSAPTIKRSEILVEQELFSGGSTVLTMKKVEKGLQSAEFQHQSKIISLLLEVIQSYQDVLLSRTLYQIKLNAEVAARKSLEKFEARFTLGEITKTDVSRARANLSDATAQREEVFGFMKNKEAFFAYKIGMDAPQDMALINYSKLNIPQTLDEFMQSVQQNNPEVAAAKMALEAAKYNVKVSEAGLSPKVTASFGLNRGDSTDKKASTNGQFNYNTASINVNIPIFSRGLTMTDIRKSKYSMRQSDLELQDKEANINSKIIEVWSEYQTYKAKILSTREAEVAANEAYEGMQEEFIAGTKTSLDLLNSEAELFQMQMKHEQTKRQLILSIFQIRALIGDLDRVDFTIFN